MPREICLSQLHPSKVIFRRLLLSLSIGHGTLVCLHSGTARETHPQQENAPKEICQPANSNPFGIQEQRNVSDVHIYQPSRHGSKWKISKYRWETKLSTTNIYKNYISTALKQPKI